ncbi:MAG TPA: S8 family serine peptidase [Gaiellaceae bacterium]|nr:S8 family serine peptidase [Gaiellaceae bacterium]
MRRGGGVCGESRASGLWGTGRGGRTRGLLALALIALATPFSAAAADGHGSPPSYLAPSLQRAAAQTPDSSVEVIVQGPSASSARNALDEYGSVGSRLGVVDAAAGTIEASDLTELADRPGLVITPDNPVVLDTRKTSDTGLGSGELWPRAVGVDQYWGKHAKPIGPAPTIAFVDSGIEPGRTDFGNRVLASVDMTDLPDNSPSDGFGHGTLVSGLAAGSAPHYTGAAPTAGIVSLDVMDDQGKARTSDVIAAAQWILAHRDEYDIRVANFSLHSATESSFRWDPLDKAVEKLWFSGVVVVASAGNQGQSENKPVRMGFAPANDPFVVTVGALDLHNSTNTEQTSVAPWSAWGYTYDGFAKPEISAPGRLITGPVPAGSTLATDQKNQVVQTADGTYIKLSGTSLSAPIASGVADDLLALRPDLTPDQVKGALMLGALPLRKVRTAAAGVGEVNLPAAAAITAPPNPNRALDHFLVPDPAGDGVIFDDAAWHDAAKACSTWNAVSWSDGWNGALWSVSAWATVSWSDVSWSDVSWSDVSWSDVSWEDLVN